MVLLLAALARGPRLGEALSRCTGLNLIEVEALLSTATAFGWVELQSRRLTDAGRGHLNYVKYEPQTYGALLPEKDIMYFPRSLRALGPLVHADISVGGAVF